MGRGEVGMGCWGGVEWQGLRVGIVSRGWEGVVEQGLKGGSLEEGLERVWIMGAGRGAWRGG